MSLSKKVIVFGGGMIGSAIAERLFSNDNIVFIADIKRLSLKTPWLAWVPCDFESLDIDLSKYDLAVNCVPSKYGYKVAEYVVKQGINCIDVSFYEEDPFTLDQLVRDVGATYIPDAGFAPGLTNLLFGRKYAELGRHLRSADISVGGFAQCPFDPYGYSVTWSLEDLMEEYKRPARFIKNEKIITASENYVIPAKVNGIALEGMITDGLRTLLRYHEDMMSLKEYTLRWPGHYSKVIPYVKTGNAEELIQRLKAKCVGPDMVVMQCFFNFEEHVMVLKGSEDETAMQKATAGTCAAISQVVLDGQFQAVGVHPPEELGKQHSVYLRILDRLEKQEGIVIR